MQKLRKNLKKQKAQQSENFFSNFCKKNQIEHIKIDDPKVEKYKNQFLINHTGKCPDYYCKKDKKEIFVEIKTLTNLTNDKREKALETNGEIIAYNPTEERRGPLTTIIKDANKKFKNVKKEYNFPKVVFINGIVGFPKFDLHALLLGAYETYKPIDGKLVNIGYVKKLKEFLIVQPVVSVQ